MLKCPGFSILPESIIKSVFSNDDIAKQIQSVGCFTIELKTLIFSLPIASGKIVKGILLSGNA